MPRSVNAVASRARRKKVLKLAKGNFGSRGNVWTVAKNTVEKGLQFAYRNRKEKKRNYRSLWIQRINAAARMNGMTYSLFRSAVSGAKENWMSIYASNEKALTAALEKVVTALVGE